VGERGDIFHYDGSSWSKMSSGTEWNLWGVWASSSSDVFVVGDGATILHYDGSSWSGMSSCTTQNVNGVWGSSSSDVFAVGDDGTILHYSGSHLPPVVQPPPTVISTNPWISGGIGLGVGVVVIGLVIYALRQKTASQ